MLLHKISDARVVARRLYTKNPRLLPEDAAPGPLLRLSAGWLAPAAMRLRRQNSTRHELSNLSQMQEYCCGFKRERCLIRPSYGKTGSMSKLRPTPQRIQADSNIQQAVLLDPGLRDLSGRIRCARHQSAKIGNRLGDYRTPGIAVIEPQIIGLLAAGRK
jgi:hypothetical protein